MGTLSPRRPRHGKSAHRGLSEVQAIIIECVQCGTTLSNPPSKWTPKTWRCQNCNSNVIGPSAMEVGIFEGLADNLRTLLKHKEGTSYRIRFKLSMDVLNRE